MLIRVLSLLQGAYYLLTGIWPLLHMPSFLAVTGPKVDLWLVQCVGILVGVIGGVLLVAGWRSAVPMEIRWLAIGSAAGLAWIDFYYSAIGRIWPVYQLDGVAEVAFILAWAVLSVLYWSKSASRPF